MDDESIFELSSSEFDSIPDTADSSEADSLAALDSYPAEPEEQGSAISSEPDSELDEFSSLSDSSFEAVTSVSSLSVTMDNSEILYRMERLEGRQVSLLYTQYILISLLISGFIIKMIFHFTSFDRYSVQRRLARRLRREPRTVL